MVGPGRITVVELRTVVDDDLPPRYDDGDDLAPDDLPPARPPLRPASNSEVAPPNAVVVASSMAATAGSTKVTLDMRKAAATNDVAAFARDACGCGCCSWENGFFCGLAKPKTLDVVASKQNTDKNFMVS